MRRILLAGLALLSGTWADGPAEACAADGGCEADAAAYLQLRSGAVCPGSEHACAGQQCCPGIEATGDKTFPCPSAQTPVQGCGVQEATCPGSRHHTCSGNTCCPDGSPCPLADPNFNGCESFAHERPVPYTPPHLNYAHPNSRIIQVTCSGHGYSAIKANDCDSCPPHHCNSQDCEWVDTWQSNQAGMCTDRGGYTPPTPAPTPSQQVWCGHNTANSCEQCPYDLQGNYMGYQGCHGDCTWEHSECRLKTWGR